MRFALRCFAIAALSLSACGGDDGSPSLTAEAETETGDDSTSTTSGGATTTPSTTGDDGSTSTTGQPGSSSTTEPDETTGTTGANEQPSSARHTAIAVGTDGAPQGYWEYLPPDYDSLAEPPPLLVFLHGVGANGNGDSELNRVLETGIPRLIQQDQWPNERPFVVLSPQYDGDGCPGATGIETFVAWAIETYDIDPSRVYLTALSCGAFGGWSYLGQVSDTQIAATVLIAGNGISPFNQVGCDLARVPIWAFHGDADDIVPVNGTTTPVNGLLQCQPTPDVQMTIYPGVGHDSWSRTYDGSAGHDIYSWLLQYPGG